MNFENTYCGATQNDKKKNSLTRVFDQYYCIQDIPPLSLKDDAKLVQYDHHVRFARYIVLNPYTDHMLHVNMITLHVDMCITCICTGQKYMP